jgi:hypothetical protein
MREQSALRTNVRNRGRSAPSLALVRIPALHWRVGGLMRLNIEQVAARFASADREGRSLLLGYLLAHVASMAQEKGFEKGSDYLRSLGEWHNYRRLQQNRNRLPEMKFVQSIVRLFHIVGGRIEIDNRMWPWTDWRSGSTVVAVVGTRSIRYPGVGKFERQGVDRWDVIALKELVNILARFGLDVRLEQREEPSDLPPSGVRKALRTLWNRRPEVGCVVCLGSPVTNPLSEGVAQVILEGREAPGRFRWAAGVAVGREACLSIPEPCKPSDEGIWTRSGCIAARTHETVLLAKLQEEKVNARFVKGFKDCGILLLSHRENQPVLIVAAGHGGLGTVAAVGGLAHPIDRFDPDGKLDAETAFGIVEVPIRKRTERDVDDLEPDSSSRVTWKLMQRGGGGG